MLDFSDFDLKISVSLGLYCVTKRWMSFRQGCVVFLQAMKSNFMLHLPRISVIDTGLRGKYTEWCSHLPFKLWGGGFVNGNSIKIMVYCIFPGLRQKAAHFF